MTESYYAPATKSAQGLMQRAATILPMARYARYVPKNPFLIGAALLGVAGVFAWRNREKIKATAGPLLQNAADKTAALREQAVDKAAALRERIRPSETTEAAVDNLH